MEGRDLGIEARFAGGRYERLPTLASDLIRLKPDVLVAEGTPAARAAKAVSSDIPIVLTLVADPVAEGLVASLARPGGNLTGLADLQTGLVTKRLELLKETVPSASRFAVLLNPANKALEAQLKAIRVAATSFGVTALSIEVGRADDVERGFAAIRKERSGGLIVLGDAHLGLQAAKIIELAAKNRLPAIYPERRWSDAGGLMSYGSNLNDVFRRAAVYVDKILKGAKPADLPVEQPTKFELIINLKIAKALGLTIPPSLLLRADQVIE